MNRKTIVYYGETCKDVTIFGRVERLCPEAPAPCLLSDRGAVDMVNEGMCKNVLHNVKSISNKLQPKTQLDQIIVSNKPDDLLKVRYYDEKHRYMLMRHDIGNTVNRIKDIERVEDADIVVISDYDKGFLTTEDISKIMSLYSDKMILMDTKKPLDTWACGAIIIKINDKEFDNTKKSLSYDLNTLLYGMGALIVTKGADGCDLYTPNKKTFIPCSNKVVAADTCGAGDTFLAALVVSCMMGQPFTDACYLANSIASEVVTKTGVSIPW